MQTFELLFRFYKCGFGLIFDKIEAVISFKIEIILTFLHVSDMILIYCVCFM